MSPRPRTKCCDGWRDHVQGAPPPRGARSPIDGDAPSGHSAGAGSEYPAATRARGKGGGAVGPAAPLDGRRWRGVLRHSRCAVLAFGGPHGGRAHNSPSASTRWRAGRPCSRCPQSARGGPWRRPPLARRCPGHGSGAARASGGRLWAVGRGGGRYVAWGGRYAAWRGTPRRPATHHARGSGQRAH
eukprot:4236144-Prymnesium_polylepis.1